VIASKYLSRNPRNNDDDDDDDNDVLLNLYSIEISHTY